jgi:hypothetical protein
VNATREHAPAWTSNKATFVVEGDRLVKRYARSGDARRDAALLTLIEQAFEPVAIDGWQYRPLRVWSADETSNEIVMEHLAGESLQAAFDRTRSPELFVHAGRWLGALHRATERDDKSVMVFNDYNRSNLIVDAGRREVVGIDPGVYESERADPAISIVIAAFSLSRAAGPGRTGLQWRALSAFIRGYEQGRQRAGLPPLMPGFRYLFWRIRTGRSRALINRPRILRMLTGAVESLFLGALLAAASRAERTRP